MDFADTSVTEPANDAGAAWMEITHPLADAMKALAGCVETSPEHLRGGSIALTARGTLLLNRHVWNLCRAHLEALSDLQARPVVREKADVVSFLLVESQ